MRTTSIQKGDKQQLSGFGSIKEQIFADLENKYSLDKKLFKESVTKFVKLMVKSKPLNELFQNYNILLSTHFDDISTAKEYIEETVEYLRSVIGNTSPEQGTLRRVPIKDIQLFEGFARADTEIDPHIKALDVLVFGNKKNIKERIEAKQLLAAKMVKTPEVMPYIDPKLRGVFFEILGRKLKSKMENLTETEIKAISAFTEQDETKILNNYIHLIDDNVSNIDEQLTSQDGSHEQVVKLNQVKTALLEMKENKQPTLDNLERLLVLKDGFTENV